MLRALFRPLLLLAGFAPALATIAQPPAATGPPLIKQDSRTKVADHVFVILDDNVGFIPNVGIVVGSKATLIIDTGMGDRNGRIILDEARKLSGNTDFYLTATHFHPEHDLGANGFPPNAKLLRWRGQQVEADQDGMPTVERFKSFSPGVAELLNGVSFRPADVLFDDEITVDLGGVHVKVFGVGPNHTRGDTSFFVIEDRVLFTGDTVMPVLPAVGGQSASLKKWLENLDDYEALAPTAVVPAHGKLIDLLTCAATASISARCSSGRRPRSAAARRSSRRSRRSPPSWRRISRIWRPQTAPPAGSTQPSRRRTAKRPNAGGLERLPSPSCHGRRAARILRAEIRRGARSRSYRSTGRDSGEAHRDESLDGTRYERVRAAARRAVCVARRAPRARVLQPESAHDHQRRNAVRRRAVRERRTRNRERGLEEPEPSRGGEQPTVEVDPTEPVAEAAPPETDRHTDSDARR